MLRFWATAVAVLALAFGTDSYAQTRAQYRNSDGSVAQTIVALFANGVDGSAHDYNGGSDPTQARYTNGDGSISPAVALVCPNGSATQACPFQSLSTLGNLGNITATSGIGTGFPITANIAPSGSSTAIDPVFSSQATYNGDTSGQILTGGHFISIIGYAVNNTSSSGFALPLGIAVEGKVANIGTGTWTNAESFNANFAANNGTVPNWWAYFADFAGSSGPVTLAAYHSGNLEAVTTPPTNLAFLYVPVLNSSPAGTTLYGLYFASQNTGFGAEYAIYNADSKAPIYNGGPTQLGGNLAITGATAPTLANGTLGLYASATNGGIIEAQGSTNDLQLLTSGGSLVAEIPHGVAELVMLQALSTNASGFQLTSGAASATAPTFVPSRSSATTGLGSAAANDLDLIANATDVVRVTTAGISVLTGSYYAGASQGITGTTCTQFTSGICTHT